MLKVTNLTRLHIGPVDFVVANGECVAITGPSGSGKSVLLRSIVDLDPNSGEIQTDTLTRSKCSPIQWRKAVAMLPAESGWWADHVETHFHNTEDLPPLLEQIALHPDALQWEVAHLSTGEKHRLALLRCLESKPEVLLLDEPTAALDHATTLQVEALLGSIMAKGTSIVIVTHDPDQATRLANHHLHLENGQLKEVSK